MPGRKTEATELSLAFGVLGINPEKSNFNLVEPYFDGSLSEQKYIEFHKEFTNSKNHKLYLSMFEVGFELREKNAYFQTLPHIHWTGPEHMAKTAAMAKDIEAGVIPISVKASSDVVANMSPYNIFQVLSAGELPASRMSNWYSFIAPDQYQELYEFVRDNTHLNLPRTIIEFDGSISKSERKILQQAIKSQKIDNDPEFIKKYRKMAHFVAQKSSDLFNTNLNHSLNTRSRSATLERIAKTFFRFNSVNYYLAGIDRNQKFTVQIPDITNWWKKWEFESIIASPDLNAGQPQCSINIQVRDKANKTITDLTFRVEIRWSHGKFCGNPEGKLYKTFAWYELPFFIRVI